MSARTIRRTQRRPVGAPGELLADWKARLHPAEQKTLSDSIIAQIRDALFTGTLKPGDYVGSEASLAERFSVSRMAARDAVRGLVANGIVEIRKGAGGGIRIAKGDPERFADALAIQLKLLGVSLADVVDAQIATESVTAELAAQRATKFDIDRMRGLLAQAAAQGADGFAFTDTVMQFHIALAEASRNGVLSTLLKGFVQVLVVTYGRNTTPERVKRVLRNYGMLVDAIARRDPEAARVTMRDHLLHARDALAASGQLGALDQRS